MEKTRVISFYLPQFHPTPENDEWWGKGFTEWTNVAAATPRFRGHYQPHLPADLGFYDLRVAETRDEQARLAREYGVYGFCYYHYWFEGKRLISRVLDDIVETGRPDFPFCICWANETWTRTWTGRDTEILFEQTYSKPDHLNHIRFLIRIFKDPRYIRINGRPLLLIYRAAHLAEHFEEMLSIWNSELQTAGIRELYICSVRTPPADGYEASVDFFPSERLRSTYLDKLKFNLRTRFGINSKRWGNTIIDYPKLVDSEISKPRPSYHQFLCPVPSWDNTPRKSAGGSLILRNSSPKEFKRWFDHCLDTTVREFDGEERIIFINAWNEWAEGAHLEPDMKWGRAYLEAVRASLESADQLPSGGVLPK